MSFNNINTIESFSWKFIKFKIKLDMKMLHSQIIKLFIYKITVFYYS